MNNNEGLQKEFQPGAPVEVYANPAAYSLAIGEKANNEMTWIKGRYVSKAGIKKHSVDISPGYSGCFSDECIRPFETSAVEQKIASSHDLSSIKMELQSFKTRFTSRQRARGRSQSLETTEVEKDITCLANTVLKLVQYLERSSR